MNTTEHTDSPQAQAHGEKNLDEDSLHFCDNSEDSHLPDSQSGHLCVGCVHSPFMSAPVVALFEQNTDRLANFFEKTTAHLSPSIDGPFQPPKA